jgi:uncharacterized protein (TIGR02246 family)
MLCRSVVFVIAIGLISVPGNLRADEAAVRKSLSGYVDAFNSHDAKVVASFWTENGTHKVESTGEEISGRAAIEADIASVFKQSPTVRLTAKLDKLRMIRPDVARGEGEAVLTGGGEDPSITRFTVILVVSDGKWLIDSVDERPVSAASSAEEALAELDWLTGTWSEESDAGRLTTVFQRSATGAFLLRSFVLTTADGPADQGNQIIAWDPALQQIRSWTFHGDGGFGEAVWSRNGADWLIRSSQTLLDGRTASGTYVLKQISGDELSFQLIGHEIDGEPQPSTDPVVMKRSAASTATDAPAPEKESDVRKTN